MFDNLETETVRTETMEKDDGRVIAMLDICRELTVFEPEMNGGPDGDSATDADKAKFAELFARVKAFVTDDGKEPECTGTTVGGGLRTVIDGEPVDFTWELSLRVKGAKEIALEEMREMIREAIGSAFRNRGMAGPDVQGPINASDLLRMFNQRAAEGARAEGEADADASAE